jgi:hypothetical protein
VKSGTSEFEQLRRLAYVLDTAVGIPGTRIRLGLDALLGLLPGIGDALGALLSGYGLLFAARRRVPLVVLLRMLGNILVDASVGVIPIVGDLFDIRWKASTRNVRLLLSYAEEPRLVRRQSLWRLAGAAGLLAGIIVLSLALGLWLIRALFGT